MLRQAKGNTVAHASKTVCPNPRGFGEEFYSNGSRAGLLIRFGCVQGLHSFNLVSVDLLKSFSGSSDLALGGVLWNEEYYSFHLLGVLVQ